MLKYLILTAIFVFILFPSLSFAAITYSKCEVNDCKLTIGECSSGILYIYQTSTCSGSPSYKDSFSSSSYFWKPASLGTYYLRALCDDGVKKTACTPVQVQLATTTTSTTSAKEECPNECCENEPNYYDKECPSGEKCVDGVCEKVSGKADYTWLIVVVVLIIIFLVLFFVLKPRRKKVSSFEQLYRKWVKFYQ